MKLMRLGPAGAETPVMSDLDGVHYDLSSLTADIDPAFFASDGVARAARACSDGKLARIDIQGLRVGAPITRPGVVLSIGLNYAAHAAEANAAPPTEPVMFYKPPNTIIGPSDDILIPRGAHKVDWEVELAVVIGRRARYLDSPAAAMDHVAGYTISNDVSERHFQLERSGGQWSKGKSFETFNPLGPWLVTPDEVGDAGRLNLESRVNGDIRQSSNTKDMIFDVGSLIYELSQVTVLEAGDLINTGTPEGVAVSGRFPYLAEGDVVTLSIDCLGVQRQVVGQA